jgi:4-hydroxy-tetrahydrodipicolinate synthase
LPLLSLGAKGAISAVGNIIPSEISTLCRTFFENDIKKSREIAHKINGLIGEMFAEVSPIPLKYALSLMGMCKNELRLPLSPTGREKEIREVLSKNNII